MAQQNPHGTAGGPGLDSDLDDLLGNGADSSSPSKSVAQSAFASTSTYTYADRHKSYYSSHGGLGCCGYLSAWCWLTFRSSPKCGWILTLLALIGLAYGLMYLLDPTVEVGVVSHDWTNVNSQYDLKAGDINHWCLAGDDSSCRCEDPLLPADRGGELSAWLDVWVDKSSLFIYILLFVYQPSQLTHLFVCHMSSMILTTRVQELEQGPCGQQAPH